ncbi:PhnA domain-containing protein [Leisingera sp. F5]|uniref:PhnA domain-containing protein n=1 Tax=Leisingera sp. F5 TaxID=1813816 RepID=UPI000AF3CB67
MLRAAVSRMLLCLYLSGGRLLICPECAHEWAAVAPSDLAADVRDSVGNVLCDGDTVTVVKDLKL